MPAGRRYDAVLVLCRSGTTTEIIDLLARLDSRIPTVVITAVPDGPVSAAADAAAIRAYQIIEAMLAEEGGRAFTRWHGTRRD